MSDASPVLETEDGVTVALRVTPKARRQRIEGVVADAKGRPVIKVTVTAAPEDGKANKALIAFLSRAWKVPKSTMSIRTGATSRNKILSITGESAALRHRIEEKSNEK